MDSHDASVADAVLSLKKLKAEHRELTLRIAADSGMDPQTRRALLEHLLDEEDEHVETIATRAADAAGVSRATAASTASASRSTIGSLRPAPPPTSGAGSIGSLRKEIAPR